MSDVTERLDWFIDEKYSDIRTIFCWILGVLKDKKTGYQ